MPAVDSGLLAAILFAGGVTVVVAIGMVVVRQHRAAQLTASRGVLSATLGLGVMALVGLGIVALSPVSAQAATSGVTSVAKTGATSGASHSVVDVQLPTK